MCVTVDSQLIGCGARNMLHPVSDEVPPDSPVARKYYSTNALELVFLKHNHLSNTITTTAKKIKTTM